MTPGGYASISSCEIRAPVPRKMRVGGGCCIKLSLNFFFSAWLALGGGGGGSSARRQICAVACRLDSAGPSWLMATRFAPFSSSV
eukprot:3915759-Prymnesium_polylepis.1